MEPLPAPSGSSEIVWFITESDNHSPGAGTLFIRLSLSSQYLVQCLLHSKSSRDICWLDELIHLLSLFWLSYHVPDTVGIYLLSHVWLFCDPMDCSWPGSLSMGFPRQENWSRLPFPAPRDLPHPGIKPMSPASPALAGRVFTTELPRKPLRHCTRPIHWHRNKPLGEINLK